MWRFLELGPDAVLSPAGRRIAPNSTWIPTRRLGQDPVLATMNGLAELFEQGTEIAWGKVYPDSGRVPLPTYPFQRVHHPVDASARPVAAARPPVVEERSIERSGAALKRIPLDPPRSNGVVPHGWLRLRLSIRRSAFRMRMGIGVLRLSCSSRWLLWMATSF